MQRDKKIVPFQAFVHLRLHTGDRAVSGTGEKTAFTWRAPTGAQLLLPLSTSRCAVHRDVERQAGPGSSVSLVDLSTHHLLFFSGFSSWNLFLMFFSFSYPHFYQDLLFSLYKYWFSQLSPLWTALLFCYLEVPAVTVHNSLILCTLSPWLCCRHAAHFQPAYSHTSDNPLLLPARVTK